MIEQNAPMSEIMRIIRKSHTLDVDLEFKRRIVENNPPAVRYFLGDFSKDIVDYISNRILKKNALTEYYEFFAAPWGLDSLPEWHKISLYKANSNCTLHSYSSTLACRHFCKVANKNKKEAMQNHDIIEYLDYASLLKCDQPETAEDDIALIRAKKAYAQLNEKDQHVLKLLVIEKHPALDVFDELSPYITPRATKEMSSEAIKESWDDKRKQDAVSLMKGRAVSRLIEMYHITK